MPCTIARMSRAGGWRAAVERTAMRRLASRYWMQRRPSPREGGASPPPRRTCLGAFAGVVYAERCTLPRGSLPKVRTTLAMRSVLGRERTPRAPALAGVVSDGEDRAYIFASPREHSPERRSLPRADAADVAAPLPRLFLPQGHLRHTGPAAPRSLSVALPLPLSPCRFHAAPVLLRLFPLLLRCRYSPYGHRCFSSAATAATAAAATAAAPVLLFLYRTLCR